MRGGGGCVCDGCWKSRLAGAPQSAGHQGAAAAVGHGVDWGLRGCDIPVCFCQQTLDLLTYTYRDKSETIMYEF